MQMVMCLIHYIPLQIHHEILKTKSTASVVEKQNIYPEYDCPNMLWSVFLSNAMIRIFISSADGCCAKSRV